MRKALSLLALAAVVAFTMNCARAEDELAPGLVGEYFDMGSPPSDFPNLEKVKPTYVRVDKTVAFGDTADDFYGIRMADNFAARWTGTLKCETAGKYTFYTESDDGSRLSIDGKVVVDNGGVHAEEEKNGSIELTAGDHAIKIEYFEAGGGAGCTVSWLPPKGKQEAIPEKALFHKKGAENIDFDKVAWEKRPKSGAPVTGNAKPGPKPAQKPGKYADTIYGPYQTGTVEAGIPSKGNIANKGLCVRVGSDKNNGVCYDMEQLRVTCAWTEGFLKPAMGRDGLEGHPFVLGNPQFGTHGKSIGWAKGDDWKDPRAKPWGPLPKDWAKYKGLYMNGDNVVLSYTVSNNPVLEMPGMETKDGLHVFSRYLTIAKSDVPLQMLICEREKAAGAIAAIGSDSGTNKSGPAGANVAYLEDKDGIVAAGIAGAPEGATWDATTDGRLILKLPAIAAATNLQVLICSGAKADLIKLGSAVKGAKPIDLTTLTKGGAPHWTEKVVTQGVLGADNVAYTLDTITVPYENPYKTYFRITGVDFFSDNKTAAVSTIDGDVWIVKGIDDKLEKIEWSRFATGMFQALGLKIVDDTIYVTGREQITRLHDLNKDGECDFYECFNNDCAATNNYHEFAHDLHTDSEGNFYFAKGSNLGSNGSRENGTVVKISKDGSTSEIYCVGFRAPNGMCVGPGDQITTGDNQGNWVPASPINWCYKPGSPMIKKDELGFYGFRLDTYPYTKQGPRINPLVWIPYDQDNSCGGQVWATGEKWGPLQGDLLHMSYGKCLLFHAMIDKVGDEVQGAVTKFPLSFASGVMRARMNKADGQLYLVGMKGWQTSAGKDGCFQRVRYTGKPANMPKTYHVLKTGIELGFTDALDKEAAVDVQNWGAQWFHVEYTNNYGSPEFKVSDHKQKGRENVTIKSVKISEDGKKVTLEMPELKPVTNLVIKYKVKAADGSVIQQELDATINRMPE
jgi:hypothetical protein